MRNKNKGFTLIEMLVVIAVIGLLAALILVGLSSFRTRGRDTRRIADLKEVQNGLEVYYMKNGNYPNVNTWSALETALVGADIGITSIPKDPTATYNYVYGVDATQQHYVIGATIEDEAGNQSLLANDLDGTVYNVNCNDPVYCVGM
jgi:prepilin-type N-terminal cleavage/methylation domain-containing protein